MPSPVLPLCETPAMPLETCPSGASQSVHAQVLMTGEKPSTLSQVDLNVYERQIP
ncbi:hypothetical protein DPMN_121770 [Dreissena polymorpha]|uniref:Uncharacterized protein n=1 Tax=Dreissena polymorpha TaxID=45954 RepID=A0A9D4JPV4_DREPO|nr:hypothetical protein DPMN_121770 [Dreissena polymorpha]